jgi:hypothetical protein
MASIDAERYLGEHAALASDATASSEPATRT